MTTPKYIPVIGTFGMALLLPVLAFAGSQTYSAPGSYTFTVPSYTGTLTVEVWGGGQHSDIWSIADFWGDYGGASSFNGTVVANGGGGGNIGNHPVDGGTASGGDVNVKGNPAIWQGGFWASGGNAPYGGQGGFNPTQSSTPDWNGIAPGGGGGCQNGSFIVACVGGGSGGYAKKTYTAGQLTAGASIPVVVGAGGFNANNYGGGNGGNGKVAIVWDGSNATSSADAFSCAVTFDKNPVAQNESTTMHWSSSGSPDAFYINSYKWVGASGSTQISRSETTDYSGEVYKCPTGMSLTTDGSACVSGDTGSGAAGSQTYSAPGSYTFTVPSYTGTLTVEVWGGGQHSDIWSGMDFWGDYGGDSSFNNTLLAGGGGGGNIGNHPVDGGTASGGDVNVKGNPAIWQGGFWASGGNAPSGGIGGFNPDRNANPNINGTKPGAGGGCELKAPVWVACIGGGSGGYVKKTYSAGDLAPGTSIPVVVGAGGFNAQGYGGGNGADGMVKITWGSSPTSSSVPPQTATCPATLTVGGSCIDGQVLVDGVCTCPAGQQWNATLNQCVAVVQCPDGQPSINGVCSCPSGQQWSASLQQCVASVQCPDGTPAVGGVCTCPAGQSWNGTQCVAATCPVGSVMDTNGECVCADGTPLTNGTCAGSILGLTVQPVLVTKGSTVTVSWQTVHMSMCTVGNTANAISWTGLLGANKVSSPITGQTTFTLSCIDLLNTPLTESKTVNVVPTFNEQ